MIQAIIKLQSCTTKPGRRAFVPKGQRIHGIAAGVVRFYVVTGGTWAAIRRAVASYDSTGARTMGFSNVRPETVETFKGYPIHDNACSIRPLPLGTTASQFEAKS